VGGFATVRFWAGAGIPVIRLKAGHRQRTGSQKMIGKSHRIACDQIAHGLV
jgi:hypothetical protein